MLYQREAQGDWGQMQGSDMCQVATETLAMTDGCKLFMQAEQDKAVLISGSRKLYEALASSDKTWKTYPNYAHDSEFEADRTQMDRDIVAWIGEHAGSS